MTVKIICDSTADLLKDTLSKVQVVPLTVRFGKEEYIDKVTIDNNTFYNKLIESDEMPTTSQATPADFDKVFSKIDPKDSAVCITLASNLSGTYQSARIAESEYDNIYVVDSTSVTVGASVLVELAVRYAEEGLDAQTIAAKLEEDKKKIVLVALVDTLEYLKKGGRISSAIAIAGTLFNIKPVLAIEDGEIKILGKARGSKQGNNYLIQEIKKNGGVDFTKPVLLGYTGTNDDMLRKYIEDSKHIWQEGLKEVRYTSVGSVIGTHAGPGAIAVAFFKK
ncbi:MAG: DegV family protein [Erysipelotrichaceae bacterium]